MAERLSWSTPEEEILEKLSKADCTLEEMLKVFHYRSESSVRAALRRKKLTYKKVEATIDLEAFNKIMKGK